VYTLQQDCLCILIGLVSRQNPLALCVYIINYHSCALLLVGPIGWDIYYSTVAMACGATSWANQVGYITLIPWLPWLSLITTPLPLGLGVVIDH